jgi:DNA-directed RNA polymerase subunit RPC12/RpoP
MGDTYTMQFTCGNCRETFNKEIEKGRDAKGQGGTCPYCGRKDYPLRPFMVNKPEHQFYDSSKKL